MDTDSFIAYIKTEDVYADIAKEIEKRLYAQEKRKKSSD